MEWGGWGEEVDFNLIGMNISYKLFGCEFNIA